MIRKMTTAYVVTTFAGTTSSGHVDGASPTFSGPYGVAVDSSNNIWVADTGNYTIRMINQSGFSTLIAGAIGTSGGTTVANGTSARFSSTLAYLYFDTSGNLYIGDTGNTAVRVMTPSPYTVLAYTSYAAFGVVITQFGNVYLTTSTNVYKIQLGFTNPGPSTIATYTGSGTSGYIDNSYGALSGVEFSTPNGIVSDSVGNLFIADQANNVIRKISTNGIVTTLAGSGSTGHADGTGSSATFNGPQGITIDSSGNIWVADTGNNSIRQVTQAGVVTTIAGSTSGTAGSNNANGTSATFSSPRRYCI